jgi:hypothetical protein
MDLILQEYIDNNGEPDELMKFMMSELDFLFKRNIRLFGYLNVAAEISFDLVFAGEISVNKTELKELNKTRLPNDKIIHILEQGLLVRDIGDEIVAGPIIEVVKNVRFTGIELRDPQFGQTMRELIALIAIALTKGIFDLYGFGKENIFPRSAMAVLHLLADMMIKAEETGNPIDVKYQLKDYYTVMRPMVTPRQQTFFIFQFISIIDGQVRLLDDIDTENGELIVNKKVVAFLERMRELIREYTRQRSSQ